MQFRILFVFGALALSSCANTSVLRTGADPNLALADVAMEGDAPAMALRVADAVLAHDQSNVAGFLHQGAALAALGRTSEAALSYKRALALAPRSREARIGLGKLELEIDPMEAGASFAAVLRDHPNDVTALIDRGVALDLEGQHAAAQSSYRKALAQQPDANAAEVDLALSLALAGQAKQAVGMLQPLASGPGNNPKVRDDLAAALAMSGDTSAASEILASSLNRSQVAQAINAYQALGSAPAKPSAPP